MNFKREGNLSFATCLILVITVSLVSALFVTNIFLDWTIEEVRAKADISIYLRQGVAPEQAQDLKNELARFAEVKEIEYISQEKALESFIERHKDDKDDQILMDSLVELGANPFLASLNIKAFEAGDYEKVASFLEQGSFANLIEKIDYHKRKSVIEKIFTITTLVKGAGLTVSLILALTSVLIAFNTVRLAIYSQRQEIAIMRLVGASNWFIRGPFLIQGALCGLMAFLLGFSLLSAVFYGLQNLSIINVYFPAKELSQALGEASLTKVIFLQLGLALVLGIIPSFVATRKYLEV